MSLKYFSKRAIAAGLGSALALIAFSVAPAMAASSFGDNLWAFASGQPLVMIDFNKGNSKVYDDSQLHVGTDDYLFLDAPIRTATSGALLVGGNLQVTGTSVTFAAGTAFSGLPAAAGAVALAPTAAQTILPTGNTVPLAVQESAGGNANLFNANNAAGTTVFSVGATGNTAISGTLAVTNDVNFNGNVTLGDAPGDLVTFTGTPTFGTVNATTLVANTLNGSAVSSTATLYNNLTTGTIAAGVALTTGTITIGGTAQTGNMVLGSSSGTSSVLIANGAGASTVTIANGTGGNTVNVANGAGTNAVNIGTAASANTITIGSVTGASAISQLVGTGNFALNGAATSTYTVGASTTSGTITIGGTAQTGTITLGSSSGTNIVAIGAGGGATTVNLAGGTGGNAVNVATGAAANVVTVGSVTGASSISLLVGTGNFALNGAATSTYAVGAATTSGTITIGGTAQTGNLVLGSSSGTSTVLIANGAGASTVTIANGTGGNTVNIANGAGTNTTNIGTAASVNAVNIGSTNSTSTTTIASGTGRVVFTGATQVDFNGTAPGTPAVTGGAGSASIIANSTDAVGQVAATSDASNTAIVLTFNATYSVAPICVISGADLGGATAVGAAAGVIVTSSATTMTLTYAGVASAKTFNYHCFKTT